METINLGRVAFVYKGDYSAVTTYNKMDVVFDGESSFVSQIDNNVGNPLVNGLNWKYLSRGNNLELQEAKQDIATLETDLNILISDVIENVPVNVKTTNGYYDYITGVFTANAGYKSIDLLPVSAGDKLYVTGSARSTLTSLIHTYNSSQANVGYILRGTGVRVDYTDYEFIVPSGVSYVGVSTISSDMLAIVVKKVTGIQSKSYTKEESDNLYQPKVTELSGVKTYGVKWDRTNPSDYGQRTYDAVGLTASIGIGNTNGQSSFDNIYPWSEIKRCNLKINANGAKIVTFEGDTGFTLDGSNGDVFVRIPKFCVNKRSEGDYDYIEISQAGVIHPAFVENGKELNEVFVSAFEGAMLGGNYVSAAGLIPESNRTPQEFLNLAKARGKGYTLYDMRTVDLIFCLFAVEFSNRNTNRVLGYGLSDFWQGINQSTTISLRSLYTSSSTNQITIIYVGGIYTRMPVGSNILICQNDEQKDIKAFRKITNVMLDNPTNPTTITFTFSGEPISIDLTCFIGSAASDTNWCETCYVNLVDASKQLTWHTGRGNLQYNSIDVRTINAVRYRWIENILGNLWHYLPDVSFNSLQMYVCDEIEGYEMHKTVAPYKAKSETFTEQLSNGSKSDVIGQNFWITKFNYDVFSRTINIGRECNLNQQSKDGFGAFYYMGAYNTILANGGGFDHLWRCNILTSRAWITTTSKWYLYGARLIYKNI